MQLANSLKTNFIEKSVEGYTKVFGFDQLECQKHTEILGAIYFEKVSEHFANTERQNLGELIIDVKSEC